ncbi:MAG: ABC transporter ATP-binding protein [Thermoplasmatota archaeon]
MNAEQSPPPAAPASQSVAGAALKFEKVGVTFRRQGKTTEALQDFTMDVPAGQFLAVVGPSGCGKSTLINMVAGLLSPTTGTVQVDDKAVAPPGPDRIVVFQEGALFPWLDVRGNVEFGLRLAGVPKAERRHRAEEMLKLVQLEQFMHAQLHELSGGMKQRVALARALVLEPRVLLMDEPFAALDAQTREDLQSKLQDLWRIRGPTVLFITHDVREAAFVADRIAVISHRPGTLKGSVEVNAPRPRTPDDARVLQAAHEAKALLADEMLWQMQRAVPELPWGESWW